MRILIHAILIFLLVSCNNLMDADVTRRDTFIKLFSGIEQVEAAAAEITDDGFVILGNMQDGSALVIKTDKGGNRVGDIKYFPNIRGSAIKVWPGNQGFLIVGTSGPAAKLIRLDNNLNETGTFEKNGTTDYSGISATIKMNESNQPEVVVLGSYKNENGLDCPYLEILNSSLSSLWAYDYPSYNRSYENAKSVHFNNGNIVWASALVPEGSTDISYVAIPFVPEGSVHINNSSFGQLESAVQSFRAEDIQPAQNAAFGYGVIGTRANSNSTGANIFFLRADVAGNIDPLSIRYYDAATLLTGNNTVEAAVSLSQDHGTAITSTRDGGFALAGDFETIDVKDLILIKTDLLGNVIWSKTYGGAIGSETVSSIRETEDGGLLVCGTNTVNQVKSIFLMKTDKNGELKK